MTEVLLNTEQAAEILQLTAGTLTVWRCTRRYPLRYVKVGGKVRYRASDLEAFLNSRTMPGVPEQDSPRGRARR